MKKIVTLIAAFMVAVGVFAQTTVKLNIEHKLGTQNFALNKKAVNNLGISFDVTRLEYYLSNITLLHDGGKSTPATDVYILANAANGTTTADLGSYPITDIEGIRFYVGVNAPVNNEDPTQWPAQHPLAPKNPSMHWGWTAGYRFVAMEGQAGNSQTYPYELHALGNEYYYKIEIPLTAQDVFGQLNITLNADYVAALNNIDVTSGKISHGVEDATITLLRNFKDTVFSSSTGQGNIYASVNQALNDAALNLYPNPSTGTVTFDITEENVKITHLQITDITGKTIQTLPANTIGNNQIQLNTKGIYLVSLMDEGQRLLTKKLIIQ